MSPCLHLMLAYKITQQNTLIHIFLCAKGLINDLPEISCAGPFASVQQKPSFHQHYPDKYLVHVKVTRGQPASRSGSSAVEAKCVLMPFNHTGEEEANKQGGGNNRLI